MRPRHARVRYGPRMPDPNPNVALGPVDFSTHVLSLASTALISLGKMPGPDGKPHPVDLETSHHLIDVLQPGNGYSAGDYARDARAIIAGISARAALPVIAGGTGFYLRALLNGLPNLPGRDESLRARLAVHTVSRQHLMMRLQDAGSGNWRLSVLDLKSTNGTTVKRWTGSAFAPARALYAGAGFRLCGPFGDYRPSVNSAFMTLSLDA